MNPAAPVMKTRTWASANERLTGRGGRFSGGSDRRRRGGAQTAPNIDRHLADVGADLTIPSMRGGDEEYVRLGQHSLERHQRRVGHVGVGAKHFARLEEEQLSELVGERVAGVVTFRLERHAED